nr:PREDICTED: serine protease inhibitor I/II isoform X2 [Tribolium castaneum]|eukprot:XP_015838230.1 PREDICTED: serine protease inhibitor I/II isoform X2 [Tribolium castaneum]
MNSFVWVLLLVGVAVASASNSDSEVSDPHTEQCKVGDTKFKDCNFCKCTNGAFECTEKKCPDRGKRDDFSCTPGQTFKKDCNTCTCTPDGKNAVCTLKKCAEAVANATRPN